MTGRFSLADFAPVHTLRYKQSSLMGFFGIRNSSDHMLKGTGSACMGLGPKLSHLRTPSQGFTGCGSFHLRSPTGGAAKGIPLNAYTSPEALITPDTRPASVFITSRPFVDFLNEVIPTFNTKAKPRKLMYLLM